MLKFREGSYEHIENLLKRTSIYHLDIFPLSAALRDVGVLAGEERKGLSAKWLYDYTGVYHTLDKYSTFPMRVAELEYYGDFLNSLRQRLNITHELINCDLKTNLPVHVSMETKKAGEKLNIDLFSSSSCFKAAFIIHPGQTRAQGSVFLQDELKNVLLYVDKRHDITVVDHPSIVKIETPEQLLKYYKPTDKYYNKVSEDEDYIADFWMPGFSDGYKFHKSNIDDKDTKIAKCNRLYKAGIREPEPAHSSAWYIDRSFITSNKFFNIFFNSPFNIYTTDKTESEHSQRYITSEYFKLMGVENSEVKKALWYSNLEVIQRGGYSNGNKSIQYYQDKFRPYIGGLKVEELEYLRWYTLYAKEISKPYTPKKYYIPIQRQEDVYKKIVLANDFKGLAIFHDIEKTSFSKDYYELLFTIPPDFSIARSKDNTLAIINCEHGSWKNNSKLKEYILTDNFLI